MGYIFLVRFRVGDTVAHLMEKVKTKKQNSLEHVDASDLTAWRCKKRNLFAVKGLDVSFLKSFNLPGDENFQNLDPMEEMAELELEPKELLLVQKPEVTVQIPATAEGAPGIDVAVEVPATTEFIALDGDVSMSRDANGEGDESAPPIKKLKTGRQTTDDEWILAQEGWDELHATDEWNKFANYWWNQDFATTFNKSTISFTESDPRGDIISTVLSRLNDIIVRSCYKSLHNYISETLKRDSVDRDTGLILTGQPGIEKTVWLLFELVCLLSKHDPVAYYCSEGTYIFYEKAVYRRRYESKVTFPPVDDTRLTRCLINMDTDDGERTIAFMTGSRRTFPIIASSPNPKHYSVYYKHGAGMVSLLYMPLWTRKELLKGLRVQRFYQDLWKKIEYQVKFHGSLTTDTERSRDLNHRICSASQDIETERMNASNGEEMNNDDIKRRTVENVIERFLDDSMGAFEFSAQDVYKGIMDPADLRRSISKQLNELNFDTLVETISKMQPDGTTITDTSISHTLFVIEAKHAGDSVDKWEDSQVEFKSCWIKTQILERLDFLQNVDLMKILNHFKGVSFAASFNGWVYERYAINILSSGKDQSSSLIPMACKENCSGTETRSFTVQSGPANGGNPFEHHRKQEIAYFPNKSFKVDDDRLKSFREYFWTPEFINNPLFDAFCVNFKLVGNTVYPVVWILQMTVSSEHGGSDKGYERIKSIMAKATKAARTTTKEKQKVGKVEVKYVLTAVRKYWFCLAQMSNAVSFSFFSKKQLQKLGADVYAADQPFLRFIYGSSLCTTPNSCGSIQPLDA
ncbi:uncharacterized protein LAESUDRAFT_752398 [Laetiporus sulphureus 93-53]|uniref:Uncharacterized protein n=1 Tax=Laetiporus sulphureus 93-53 TaxID=1314785 RepID=A0A165C0Q0_9APHY|nr:uncharacterized protein LAESUDRAFT_752398 [Laetiporus sulphureus 93-53]KZT01990.1 hypothetical protein LAESUDRAFT_752398 [Laetiporus sulphureus 93-53]